MNLTLPNIKGETQEEKNNNLKRYLFSLVEQLNWALGTLQNDVDSAKKMATESVFDDSKTISFSIGGTKSEIAFERVGLITFATMKGDITSESSLAKVETEVEIPDGFFPNTTPSVPYIVYMENDDGFTAIGSVKFAAKNKITIGCDFFGASEGQKFICQMIFKS